MNCSIAIPRQIKVNAPYRHYLSADIYIVLALPVLATDALTPTYVQYARPNIYTAKRGDVSDTWIRLLPSFNERFEVVDIFNDEHDQPTATIQGDYTQHPVYELLSKFSPSIGKLSIGSKFYKFEEVT